MGRIFDTALQGKDNAPPKGSWRVCVEGPSQVKPEDKEHKSYRMIGDWSDASSAVGHARSAQETHNEAALKAGVDAPTIVAFGHDGQALFVGVAAKATKSGKVTEKAS